MEKHINEQKLISFITKSLKTQESVNVDQHISGCKLCRQKHSDLLLLLESSQNENITPSAYCDKRIRNISIIPAEETTKPAVLILTIKMLMNSYKPIMAATAALLIIIGVTGAVVTLSRPVDDQKTIPISISYIKGKAYINNHEINAKTRIKENSLLRVAKNSAVVLSYNNKFTIKIRGESTLEIQKALISTYNRKAEFVFDLKKGQLFTKSDDPTGRSHYYYITPTAQIKSSKTEFILKVADNKTVVIPKSGTLKIKSLESDEEVMSAPYKKYTITSSIESNDLNDFDEFNADTLKNLDNPFDEDDNFYPKDFMDSISERI